LSHTLPADGHASAVSAAGMVMSSSHGRRRPSTIINSGGGGGGGCEIKERQSQSLSTLSR